MKECLNCKKLQKEIEKLSSQVKSMEEDVDWLRCLEAVGVDNWEGYDIAIDIRDERKGRWENER